MVLPHSLLVLLPSRLGWGQTQTCCLARVCGSTAQPTSFSPHRATSILILG